MKEAHQIKIEEIIDGIKCPKGFKCAESGFDELCRARDIGLNKHLECLEENPGKCKFLVSADKYFFCCCPIRVYIAKKIKV